MKLEQLGQKIEEHEKKKAEVEKHIRNMNHRTNKSRPSGYKESLHKVVVTTFI